MYNLQYFYVNENREKNLDFKPSSIIGLCMEFNCLKNRFCARVGGRGKGDDFRS